MRLKHTRRASNGGSRLWGSGGAWAGLRVGLRWVAGGVVLVLVWDGALRVFGGFFGGGGGVLVCVCVCGGRGVWALGYHSMGLGRFPVGPGHLPNVS